ncbi:hypothetical protein JCGZ_04203 [Jatropha curcas]|uniref:Uncharacterized protein n=1 Tax=Jatropha curcas TaxID=180498 RepID=A0A067JKQ8_JATCU|nr:hypothetical protein JCGZ_04203 [Jatropha curcas]
MSGYHCVCTSRQYKWGNSDNSYKVGSGDEGESDSDGGDESEDAEVEIENEANDSDIDDELRQVRERIRDFNRRSGATANDDYYEIQLGEASSDYGFRGKDFKSDKYKGKTGGDEPYEDSNAEVEIENEANDSDIDDELRQVRERIRDFNRRSGATANDDYYEIQLGEASSDYGFRGKDFKSDKYKGKTGGDEPYEDSSYSDNTNGGIMTTHIKLEVVMRVKVTVMVGMNLKMLKWR